MAKIGWIKPTVTVYVTITSEDLDAQLSLTSEWLYQNRNKYNYLFLIPVPEEYAYDEHMYYCTNEYSFIYLDENSIGISVGSGDGGIVFDKDGKHSAMIIPDGPLG